MSGRFSVIPSAAVFDPALDPAALRVLLVLGTYTDKNGWCRVGQETMSTALGVGRTAIANQVKRLADAGYVEVKRTGRTSIYRILFDPIRDVTRNDIDPVMSRDVTSDVTSRGDIDRTTVLNVGAEAPVAVNQDRPRNPIWDALAEGFGAPSTRSEQSMFGKVVNELKQAGATGIEVSERIAEGKRRWGKPFTPMALTKHWTSLATIARSGNSGLDPASVPKWMHG